VKQRTFKPAGVKDERVTDVDANKLIENDRTNCLGQNDSEHVYQPSLLSGQNVRRQRHMLLPTESR